RGGAGHEPPPVDAQAPDVEFGARAVQAGRAVLVAAQRADHDDVVVVPGDGAQGGEQGGVGGEFDEEAVPVGDHALDGGREPDGVAQVGVPVPGVQCPGDGLAGDGGVPGDGGGGGEDAVEVRQEFPAQGFHPGGVGGGVDGEAARGDPVAVGAVQEGL